MSLRCSLANSPLDSLLCNLGGRVLDWQKVEILLRHLQLTMACKNISVLIVLGIQGSELPLFRGLALRVVEVDDLTEDGDLLDKVLQ